MISDANNRLAPGALAAVVEHFADPAVGAVAGEKLEDDGGGGESLYWRFESWLKQREDRLGTTIGLVGELSAIRAEAWRPIPPDVAIDDFWAALDIIEQGYRDRLRAAGPRARSRRRRRWRSQWERRIRSVSGALHVMVRRRHQLRPSAGLVAAELWGHRLVRYTVGPLAHVALLVMAVTKVRSSALARAFLLANLAAGAGLLAGARVGEPTEDASAGTDAPAPAGRRRRRGRGRSCSCRASRSAAWCAMRAVTGRPCGRLWSDEWDCGAAWTPIRPAGCASSSSRPRPRCGGRNAACSAWRRCSASAASR